jgi:hypothetical protein
MELRGGARRKHDIIKELLAYIRKQMGYCAFLDLVVSGDMSAGIVGLTRLIVRQRWLIIGKVAAVFWQTQARGIHGMAPLGWLAGSHRDGPLPRRLDCTVKNRFTKVAPRFDHIPRRIASCSMRSFRSAVHSS